MQLSHKTDVQKRQDDHKDAVGIVQNYARIQIDSPEYLVTRDGFRHVGIELQLLPFYKEQDDAGYDSDNNQDCRSTEQEDRCLHRTARRGEHDQWGGAVEQDVHDDRIEESAGLDVDIAEHQANRGGIAELGQIHMEQPEGEGREQDRIPFPESFDSVEEQL